MNYVDLYKPQKMKVISLFTNYNVGSVCAEHVCRPITSTFVVVCCVTVLVVIMIKTAAVQEYVMYMHSHTDLNIVT